MASARVAVRPPVLEWARHRGGKDTAAMRKKFHEWDLWMTQEAQPTLRQAQDLAAYTHVPFGMLLLDSPPVVELPIPDFRVTGEGKEQPSQDLLDTIYLSYDRMQRLVNALELQLDRIDLANRLSPDRD